MALLENYILGIKESTWCRRIVASKVVQIRPLSDHVDKYKNKVDAIIKLAAII